MKQDNNKKKCLLGAAFFTAVLYFIFSISGKLYIFTDNITVAVITGGMYSENNMCQYLHPLFCLIIKALNPILPTADVFTLLMHFFLLFGIYCISYAVIDTAFQKHISHRNVEDWISRVLLILAISYSVLGIKLFGSNYTVQTAAIIATGVMVIFHALRAGKGKPWILAGSFLIFAGFLGRVEACLLFLPFIALELLTEFIRNKERVKWSRKTAGYIIPSIIVVTILLGSKAIFLRTEPYRSDAEYNYFRTITGDYPMETYGVTYKDWKGIDKDTYIAVTHWNLADTDNISTEALKRIAEVGSRNDYQASIEGVKRTFLEMKRKASTVDVHVMILTALTIIITLWCVIAVKSVWLKLEALLAFSGGFIILFYFTFRGRAPLRVWQCVLIDALTILILVMVKDGLERLQSTLGSGQDHNKTEAIVFSDKKKKQKNSIVNRTATVIFQLLLCMILYFGIGQVMAHSTIHAPISPLTANIGADDSDYEKTFEGDSLYIWSGWYDYIPDYFSKQNKLPTQRVIDHNIAIGDWVYEQVYFRDFLQRIGAPNPALALLERPNTYLMAGYEEMMLNYLKNHYGKDIELEYSHEVNGKKAYRFIRHSVDSHLPNNTED